MVVWRRRIAAFPNLGRTRKRKRPEDSSGLTREGQWWREQIFLELAVLAVSLFFFKTAPLCSYIVAQPEEIEPQHWINQTHTVPDAGTNTNELVFLVAPHLILLRGGDIEVNPGPSGGAWEGHSEKQSNGGLGSWTFRPAKLEEEMRQREEKQRQEEAAERERAQEERRRQEEDARREREQREREQKRTIREAEREQERIKREAETAEWCERQRLDLEAWEENRRQKEQAAEEQRRQEAEDESRRKMQQEEVERAQKAERQRQEEEAQREREDERRRAEKAKYNERIKETLSTSSKVSRNSN